VAEAPPTANGNRLVLLVEDEPEVRKVIRLQLTELGYPVLEAANGLEARAMLEAVDDIAILVSDTVMPGLGGRELAAFARQLRPALPILLITGYATGPAPPAPPTCRPCANPSTAPPSPPPSPPSPTRRSGEPGTMSTPTRTAPSSSSSRTSPTSPA
jgi:hypothetical protein